MLQNTAHSVPAKKLACYNEGFMKVKSGLSWGWKRMHCSKCAPFLFHQLLDSILTLIYTPQDAHWRHNMWSKNNHHIREWHRGQHLCDRRTWSKQSIDIHTLEATQGTRLESAITNLCISLLSLPKKEQRHSMFILLLLPGYGHFNSASVIWANQITNQPVILLNPYPFVWCLRIKLLEI